MAQYSMNAYDADVYIPEFKGLMQYGDQMNGDLRFSPDCMNVETPAGVLQPAAKLKNVLLRTDDTHVLGAVENFTVIYLRAKNYLALPYTIKKFVATDDLGRSATAPAYQVDVEEEFESYLVVAGTKLYSFSLPVDLSVYQQQLPFEIQKDMITEVWLTQESGTYANKRWSFCTYETTYNIALPGEDPHYVTANVVIMSNETNGVYSWDGTTINKINSVPTTFGHVARFAERIWGVGIGDNKDRLYYSAVYNAFDWNPNATEYADGGGEIREATFDNDRLVALMPFGDALIAFSEQRAWRISGSDPSNFNIQEQYGNGTRYPESIAVIGDQLIMLGEHGLVVYDGYRVTPFMQEATYEIFRDAQLSKTGIGTPVAIAINNKYVLALANKLYNGSGTFENTGYRFLIYDRMDSTLTITDCPAITSFCAEPPYAWAAVANENEGSYEANVTMLRFDSWDLRDVSGAATKWMTPWVTLGRKDIQKGGFDLYFYPELAEDATEGVTFTFSIQTEKKTKTKSYTVQPLTAKQKEAGKKYKQKRLHFGGAGRRFRLTIETAAGVTTPWRLIGGIHIIAEIDKD